MSERRALEADEKARQAEVGRRRDRLDLFGVEDDPQRVQRQRACGCLACPDCRPEIARAAAATGVEFVKVLMYVDRIAATALTRLLDLRGPAPTRPDRRMQQRAAAKQAKKQRLAEERRRALADSIR